MRMLNTGSEWTHFPVKSVEIPSDCEAQAMDNHGGQSLARLNERGGLGPCEAIAVLEKRQWRRMTFAECLEWFKAKGIV